MFWVVFGIHLPTGLICQSTRSVWRIRCWVQDQTLESPRVNICLCCWCWWRSMESWEHLISMSCMNSCHNWKGFMGLSSSNLWGQSRGTHQLHLDHLHILQQAAHGYKCWALHVRRLQNDLLCDWWLRDSCFHSEFPSMWRKKPLQILENFVRFIYLEEAMKLLSLLSFMWLIWAFSTSLFCWSVNCTLNKFLCLFTCNLCCIGEEAVHQFSSKKSSSLCLCMGLWKKELCFLTTKWNPII